MKIIELKAENIKRLTAVEIVPEDTVTVIGGKNRAGKSSVLDSIMYALAGKKALPPKPLRDGAKSGRVEVKLDGDESRGLTPMTVIRTFTENGGGSLEIRTDKGFKAPSPQKILDDIRARFIDPKAYSRLTEAEKIAVLKDLVGLDFSELDAEYSGTFDARTVENREAKSLQTRIQATPKEEAPEKEVSVAELVKEMQRRQEVNAGNERERYALGRHQSANTGQWNAVRAADSEVVGLEKELAAAKVKAAQTRELAFVDDKSLEEKKKAVAAQQEEDTSEIQQQIATAEETNRKVRANQARAALESELAEVEAKAGALTERLDAIKTEKQTAMSGAKWPVDGLGFGETGVTWNGLPFEQASSAESLRVSVTMGFAMNPVLPVLLIYNGSLLDDDSLRSICDIAEEHNGQVFIERVGEGDECSVVIEDGHVKEPQVV